MLKVFNLWTIFRASIHFDNDLGSYYKYARPTTMCIACKATWYVFLFRYLYGGIFFNLRSGCVVLHTLICVYIKIIRYTIKPYIKRISLPYFILYFNILKNICINILYNSVRTVIFTILHTHNKNSALSPT